MEYRGLRVAYACRNWTAPPPTTREHHTRHRLPVYAATIALILGSITLATPAAHAAPCPDGTQTCAAVPTQGTEPTQGQQAPTTAQQAPQTTIAPDTNTTLPSAPTNGSPTFQGTVQAMPTPDNSNGCIVNCPTTQAPAQPTTETPTTVTPQSATTTSTWDVVSHTTVTNEDTKPRFDACLHGDRGPDFRISVFSMLFYDLDEHDYRTLDMTLKCGSEAGGLIHIEDDHNTWGDSPADVVNCIANIADFSGGRVTKATSAGYVVAQWEGNTVVFNQKTGEIKTAYPSSSWAACATTWSGPWHPGRPIPGQIY